MLVNLHVKNMALIEDMETDFGPGLNILTGETGAGKSMVIGSVNVALGAGNFKDYVSEDTDYALVELTFVTENKTVLKKLEEMDLPAEDGQVVISRRYQKGRSLSRVNGETVSLSFIREIASELIDIHGQHEHQSLLYPRFHLMLLDAFAKEELGELKENCRAAYEAYRLVDEELKKALSEGADREKQIDFYRFEVSEIESAQLLPGEDEQLEREYAKMSNGQKIEEALAETARLTGSDGAGDEVSRAVRALSGVAQYDPALNGLLEQLLQMEDLMNGFDRELSDYLEEFSYDEQEFYRIGQRLDTINHLKVKYGKTIREILAYQQEKQEKLEQLANYETYVDSLKKKKAACQEQLFCVAGKMTKVRKKAAAVLAERIRASLEELNFPDVQFSIDFRSLPVPGANGCDEICFLISTNPGMPLRPLQDVASGGELSRIMLAIKSVMAGQDAIGCLIFDEIDTGISGRTAQKVSEKMALIAKSHQVICITHLAQIAAMADTHLAIEKQVKNGHTKTLLRRLDAKESVEELARILGGAKITDAVYENAREMKELANRTKSGL